jgi:hypothetical protein
MWPSPGDVAKSGANVAGLFFLGCAWKISMSARKNCIARGDESTSIAICSSGSTVRTCTAQERPKPPLHWELIGFHAQLR